MNKSARDVQGHFQSNYSREERDPLSDAKEYPPEDVNSHRESSQRQLSHSSERDYRDQSNKYYSFARKDANARDSQHLNDSNDFSNSKRQKAPDLSNTNVSGGGRYGQSTIPSKPQSDSKTNTWSIKRTEYDTNKKNQPLDSEHRERGGYYRSNESRPGSELNYSELNTRSFQKLATKDTLNINSAAQNDVEFLKEQVAKLKQQNEEYKNQLSLLEVSLHNESLTNEEQRAYIEVLKQALEAKLNDSGLKNFLVTLQHNSKMGELDLFVELNNVKTLIEHHKREQTLAEEKANELASQVEMLSIENEELKNVIRENKQSAEQTKGSVEGLLTNIEALEIENQKLNQERASLIEYADKVRDSFEKLQAENDLLLAENKTKSGENAELHKRNRELESTNQESERRLKLFAKDLDELRSLSASLEEQIKHLEEENDRIAADRSELKVNHEVLLKEKLELERVATDWKKDYDTLHKKYSEVDSEYEHIERENKNFQIKIKDTADRLKDAEKQLISLRESKQLLESENTRLMDELQDLQKKYREFDKEKEEKTSRDLENKSLKNELNQLTLLHEDLKARFEKERNSKTEEIRNLLQQNSDMKSELRTLKEEKATQELRLKNLEHELEEYHIQIDKKQRSLITSSRETNELKKTLEEMEEECRAQQLHIDQLERENEEARKINRELHGKLLETEDDRDELQKKYESLKNENSRLRETELKLNDRIEALTHSYSDAKYDCERLQQSLEQAKRDSNRIIHEIERVCSQLPKPPYFSDKSSDGFFDNLEERIKLLLLERERLENKLAEYSLENEKIWKEHQSLLNDYQLYAKKNTALQNECDQIREELEQTKKQSRRQEDQIERFKTELQRMKEDVDRKQEDETSHIRERARLFEEKAAKHELESQCLDQLLNKYKEATLNKEIREVLDEIKVVYTELVTIQKERIALINNIEASDDKLKSLNSSPAKKKMDSPIRVRESITTRRKLEELKDNLSNVESNIDIYNTKKLALEKEFSRLIASEKSRQQHCYELEKENYHLRTEINMMTKENELLEQTKANLEMNYNDLLKELNTMNKRSQKGGADDMKSNASAFGLRESYGGPRRSTSGRELEQGRSEANDSTSTLDRYEKAKISEVEETERNASLNYNKYRKNPLS